MIVYSWVNIDPKIAESIVAVYPTAIPNDCELRVTRKIDANQLYEFLEGEWSQERCELVVAAFADSDYDFSESTLRYWCHFLTGEELIQLCKSDYQGNPKTVDQAIAELRYYGTNVTKLNEQLWFVWWP